MTEIDIETLNLIEGDFSVEEAREVLTNIFLTKIHFHQMKNFSSQERFGKQDETAVRRIPELKKQLEKLSYIVAEAKSKHKKLTISSEITLSLMDE
ncbi:hypothetical protein [Nibrella saemangeumensis]